ncbi:hypothetical protein SAMN02799624_01572 [Paenibacillus sp. UNC496MF]|uniref:hypothetical protein n=1 Tax=Paenibacillus sp. UNC496MF TaxID=1502753 RepID=UPI0008F27B95|nr:hypothetical protein [Paenibacillus sp. UNC496MF]SFI59914.1 hypothetical protein SAMN02799624_01572 [Paenibacillus sp. UNC496MF]
MRRYWFSIALPVLVAASIGTYYVGAAARDLPEFRIQTVSGDPKEASQLVLEADTRIDDGMYHRVEIGTNGTHYNERRSFLAQLNNDFTDNSPDLVRLKKDHRGFMRGKISTNGFYADDRALLYADAKAEERNPASNLSAYSIAIAAQDLTTGKKTRFDAIMPGKQKYSYLYVYDVQMLDGQAKLLVTLSKDTGLGRAGGMETEIHLLTVDLDKEGIASDETIAKDADKGAGKQEKYAIHDTSAGVASPSPYALLSERTVQAGKDKDGTYTEKTLGSQVLVLDYKTGKLTPIPAEGGEEANTARMLAGGKLITLKTAGGKLTLRSDDPASGARGETFDVPLALTGGAASSMQRFIYGDRLYVLNRVNADGEILIVNLADGKAVYAGKLTVDGTPERQRELLEPMTLYSFGLKS